MHLEEISPTPHKRGRKNILSDMHHNASTEARRDSFKVVLRCDRRNASVEGCGQEEFKIFLQDVLELWVCTDNYIKDDIHKELLHYQGNVIIEGRVTPVFIASSSLRSVSLHSSNTIWLTYSDEWWTVMFLLNATLVFLLIDFVDKWFVIRYVIFFNSTIIAKYSLKKGTHKRLRQI